MKVVLKRNLFLGNARYRVNSYGTEIPDEVDGKAVILPNAGRKVDAEKEIMLPHGTVLFDEGKVPAKVVDKPMALSQMPKAKTPSRPIAKGHEDKVDDADLE